MLFKTVKEYDAAARYIERFWVLECQECGATFECERSSGKVPLTCSDQCRTTRENRNTYARVKAWRKRQKV